MLGQPRKVVHGIDAMKGSYLGSDYGQQEITEQLTQCGAVFEIHSE
jgi:hypothetical protein